MVAGGKRPAEISSNVRLIRDGYEALGRRDWDTLLAILSEDVVLETVAQGVYQGRAGIRAWLEDMDQAWTDWSVTVARMRPLGGRVIVDAVLTGRSTYNAAELSQRFWIVWTVRDGKAVHGVHFADEAQALAFDR
jgi:ketosteroid isomerase-like protein